MRTILFLVFLGGAGLASPSPKPSQGKVRIHVRVDSTETYRGVQQRASDLEESARDLRKSLKGSKWLEVTESAEEADIHLRLRGRRLDPENGFALGYALDAGPYETEDEFLYGGQSIPTGGGRSRDARELSDAMQPRKTLGWGELAKRFGRSLEEFAEANYDRILSQRSKVR